jgi:electron transport complex protein RnfG
MDTIEHGKRRALLLITLTALIAGSLMTLSDELSRDRIAANQRMRLLATLNEVIDPALYDNDLAANRRFVTSADLLGTSEPVEVFIATADGEAVAALFSTVAPRGYNGPINLLVGVTVDGTVTGVRVTRHRETPGLGDAIEISKSAWIDGFSATSLNSPALVDWRVTKDGGHFDSITGATVTPRVIVEAVRNTLIYVRDYGNELFADLPAAQNDDSE